MVCTLKMRSLSNYKGKPHNVLIWWLIVLRVSESKYSQRNYNYLDWLLLGDQMNLTDKFRLSDPDHKNN